jgi:transcriptional regulator with XRE-family HTH domain
MNRIKQLRKEQHKTLKDVEKELGIKRSTFSDYENGKTEPNLATWRKLMKYFDVSFEYLVGWTDERR